MNLAKYFDQQIYNFLKLSVYNLKGLHAQIPIYNLQQFVDSTTVIVPNLQKAWPSPIYV